jgi:hypothetical protein
MLAMIASFPAFTQTDTTRTVGVKAYKLGYLIRDAQLFRTCDSLADKQAQDLAVKQRLINNFHKQVESLNRENNKLQAKDSTHEARFNNAQDLYVIDKNTLKTKKRKWIKIAVVEGLAIVGLVLLIL